jgi:hypothetical protein
MREREFIIENATKKEIDILDAKAVDWYPDDLFDYNSSDVRIYTSESEIQNILKLIGRA